MPCGYGEDYVDNCIVAICEAEGLSAKGDRYDQIYAQFGDSGLVDRNIDNSCTVAHFVVAARKQST